VAGLVAAACCTRPVRAAVGGWALLARGIGRLPDAGAGLNQLMVDLTLAGEAAVDVGAGGFALDVMDDVLREVGRARPVEDLARVTAPVWIVNGRWDHFRTEERRFLRACQDGRLVILRGARHLVSLDAPVAFTRVVLEALDVVEAREAAGVGRDRRGA
jgi:pimeloyl-ACP methyl ester carboxylesterase